MPAAQVFRHSLFCLGLVIALPSPARADHGNGAFTPGQHRVRDDVPLGRYVVSQKSNLLHATLSAYHAALGSEAQLDVKHHNGTTLTLDRGILYVKGHHPVLHVEHLEDAGIKTTQQLNQLLRKYLIHAMGLNASVHITDDELVRRANVQIGESNAHVDRLLEHPDVRRLVSHHKSVTLAMTPWSNSIELASASPEKIKILMMPKGEPVGFRIYGGFSDRPLGLGKLRAMGIDSPKGWDAFIAGTVREVASAATNSSTTLGIDEARQALREQAVDMRRLKSWLAKRASYEGVRELEGLMTLHAKPYRTLATFGQHELRYDERLGFMSNGTGARATLADLALFKVASTSALRAAVDRATIDVSSQSTRVDHPPPFHMNEGWE